MLFFAIVDISYYFSEIIEKLSVCYFKVSSVFTKIVNFEIGKVVNVIEDLFAFRSVFFLG